MRKIIGNLVFDTERSTQLAQVFDIGESEEKTLYKTANGRLFMTVEVKGYHETTINLFQVSPMDVVEFLERYRSKIGAQIVDEIYFDHLPNEIQEA